MSCDYLPNVVCILCSAVGKWVVQTMAGSALFRYLPLPHCSLWVYAYLTSPVLGVMLFFLASGVGLLSEKGLHIVSIVSLPSFLCANLFPVVASLPAELHWPLQNIQAALVQHFSSIALASIAYLWKGWHLQYTVNTLAYLGDQMGPEMRLSCIFQNI